MSFRRSPTIGRNASPQPPLSSSSPGSLFNRNTQAIIYNYKPNPVQRMLDFDFLCRREFPSVAGLVSVGSKGGFEKVFFGSKEIAVPVYPGTKEACKAQPQADVFINFASFRSAYQSSLEALEQPTIRVVVIIAEGVPERDVKHLIAVSKKKGKTIIGPATVGGVQAGAFKIGDTAGTVDNIVACKLHRPGSVGFVSKSGGLSNECYNILARTTDGLFEGIAVGGDCFPGTTLADHVIRFQEVPQVKMIVLLGELGGTDEYAVAEAIKKGVIKKPVVAWVSGTCAKVFPTEVQFGHAGAKSGGLNESAEAKNEALKAAGAKVPSSFEELPVVIATTFQQLVVAGEHTPAPEVSPPEMPMDVKKAMKAGKVRASTNIVSTISDDRGDEPTYACIPMSEMIAQDYSVGDVIALLWFKRPLPKYATKFIEMCLVIAADHGPCVSGAHNSIVCARAGKDLVSCVASGLLTIGPRFGGAIDDAARDFKKACDSNLAPDEFVESMKRQGKRIAGIGHRIKTLENPDKRVELLIEYSSKHFPSTRYLKYSQSVQAYTLTKSNNLILNVDGCIGALFCDMLTSSACFTEEEIEEVLEVGTMNGLFILARTIGLVGHALDQKRLKQPLYRHPWDDVLYAEEQIPQEAVATAAAIIPPSL
mmetsp:Transcript_43755/g.71143  ORF Transcript_43755/g.71143 Transcript_43755/m.71143 type:complete len:650 (+) Transcript_43755:187-2136(+)|eukprot:CAMPEP_0184649496 /NCGR_PEP_ID=MMETSP0308-20130426/6889_1 /TAXON_ID=38269 /ORGANISM="Gloeochaete witrockiana, Strain SAG 46.84" /LENGTH=649 /DNA_ID=CAMNT_0027082285 /DNA_START=110 /DNA_END=2059 /DNA_ORIENTATION=-